MNSKEKLIIQKLLAIAEKQQKVLTKLAQAGEDVEANKAYLKQAWQTAGLNTGISEMWTPTVEFTPGGPSSTDPGVTLDGNYVVTGAVPVTQREKFLRTFKAQVASQKPDLDGKVSTIFKDVSSAPNPA